MKEKVVILGKSGSGKNFLMEGLIKLGLNSCVKTTTRPKRFNELDNIDYKFISVKSFLDKISSNKMLVNESFEVFSKKLGKEIWYYGIDHESYKKSDVVILTPSEYYKIMNINDRTNCFVIYLDIERTIRKNRIRLRNDQNDSIDRRLDCDDSDFEKFTDYDLRITDPDFSSKDVYNLIEF